MGKSHSNSKHSSNDLTLSTWSEEVMVVMLWAKSANQVYVIYGRNSQTLALGGYPTAIDPPVAVILFVQ